MLEIPARPQGTTRRALELIGFALALAYALFLAACLFERLWLVNVAGEPIANDFVNVWAAGKLVLEGRPAAPYDWTIHRDAEVGALGHDFDGYYGWHYPPTFLFVATVLAALPYLIAFVAWAAVTLAAYAAMVRTIMGGRLGLLLACAFPGAVWNVSVGQNGFLTAALMGFTLTNITRRPLVAGMFLGLLTYKPQFGILFPIVLVFDGRWRVIAAAAVTAAALAAVSLVAFGVESWRAFFEWMPVTGAAVFADGRAGLDKLQSVFGVMRWLGAGTTAASIAQGLMVAGAALTLVLLWRRSVAEEIKMAALAVGALLATPYLYIYDFPVLAIPLAFLLRLGLRDGFLPYERSAIAAACGLILASPLFALPTGFAAAAVVAAMIARRAIAGQFAASSTSLRKTAATA
jgi:arabinofuranan 3-O-arabinosyltransferase